MKMKKRVLLWLVPVMLVAGVLSGCASGDEGGVEDYGITPNPKKPKNPSAPEAANYGITVSPGAVKLRKGIPQQFTAARTDGGGEGTFDWTVEGGSAEGGTAIDEDGVLTVGAGETAKELTVKAALKGDSGKYGTATALILSTEDHGLSLTPQLVLLGRGEAETFTAEIIGDDGEESPAIIWSVDDSAGSAGSGETFNYTVDDEEVEETLTVKASVSAEVYGAALITVLGGEEEGVAPIPVNYGIRVAPQSAIVVKGASMTLGAYELDGSGETVVTSDLEWDVFGGGEGTGIDDGGVLTVAALETAEYLTVRAKNLSRAGTAVVKVSAAGDIDGDGIPDAQDDDIDGDGIPNGSDPDVDGDGIPNNEDDDIDGDGIPNEQDPDVDGPGGPDVISVTLDSVSANGSSTSATTTLTLTFSQDITGLTKDHITLSGSTGAQKVTLSKASGTGKYELTVSGITADGQVTVSIGSQPSGYNITGSPSTNVYKGETTVTMTVTPNGNSTTTTTELTLGFTPGIANLALGEITISNTGNTGATKGTTLSGATTSYTLGLSGITAGGSITVTVNKSGYSVEQKAVTVYWWDPVNSPYAPNMVQVTGGSMTLNGTNVTLSSFWISNHEVTQKEWYDVMGTTIQSEWTVTGYSGTPTRGVGDDYLMYCVNWYQAAQFCNKLSDNEGLNRAYNISGTDVTLNDGADGYRLPTEAEWEYAARGGQQSLGSEYSGASNVDDVAWYTSNSGSSTHPVGGKVANELGLYDMSGNVWEWCWDWYGSSSYPSSANNPTGASSGSDRVIRGGSWNDSASSVRSANRYYYTPSYRNDAIGFRVVRSVTP